MTSEHQRQSPKSDTTSSPLPLITQSLSNSTSKMVDMKKLKVSSDECDTSLNKNDGFTLMHPAFQNVLHKRKYFTSQGIDKTMMTYDKNFSERHNLLANVLHSDINRKVETDSETRLTHHSKSTRNEYDSSGSTSSEEIDLTSNNCIDFSNSNNNNDINSNHNRKSDKCAMNTF